MAMAHGDRNNGTGVIAAAAAADKASIVRSVAPVAIHNNGFDNLVINSVGIEKHAIDIVPNGESAAGAADLQEDIISNSLNMLYQF